MEFEEMLYRQLAGDENIFPKAIANFLFREIIEDAHEKYNISQEDMKQMCKDAVNRATVLEKALADPKLTKALSLYGYSTEKWDAPDKLEVDNMMQRLSAMAQNISNS